MVRESEIFQMGAAGQETLAVAGRESPGAAGALSRRCRGLNGSVRATV